MPPEWVIRQQALTPALFMPREPETEPDLWQAMRGPHLHRTPLLDRLSEERGDPTLKFPPPIGERKAIG